MGSIKKVSGQQGSLETDQCAGGDDKDLRFLLSLQYLQVSKLMMGKASGFFLCPTKMVLAYSVGPCLAANSSSLSYEMKKESDSWVSDWKHSNNGGQWENLKMLL